MRKLPSENLRTGAVLLIVMVLMLLCSISLGAPIWAVLFVYFSALGYGVSLLMRMFSGLDDG